jgi:hypothetical protein
MMSDTEQVKSETEVKPRQKNPKRVEAGKKGAEARRLKKAQQDTVQSSPITEITKTVEEPISEKPVKINVYKNYLPIGLIVIAGLGLCMYKYKPVSQVNKQVDKVVIQLEQQEEHDPFDF